MDKIKKLSEAIRFGSTFLGDTRTSWMSENRDCGCAIGTAYLAAIDRNPPFEPTSHVMFPALRERFGVPHNVLAKVSQMHCNGATRAECADWLEARGY